MQVENAAYCPACGFALPTVPTENFCSACDKELDANAKFCPYCGEKVASDSNGTISNNENAGDNKNNSTGDAFQEAPQTVWLRITKTDSSNKTVYFYDYNGNLRGERLLAASDGHVWSATEYILDDSGNVTESRKVTPTVSTIGSYNVYTKYLFKNTYDSEGRLYSVTKTNDKTDKTSGSTEYTYDANGNIKEITEYYSNGSIDTVTIYENGRIAFVEYREEGKKETYEYDTKGRLIKKVLPGTPAESVSGGITDGQYQPENIVTEYTYDENDNVISENKNGSKATYTYMTLEEYRSLNKHIETLPELAEFPSYIGSAGCSYCSSHGNDSCIGHDCPICNGAGSLTCNGCHGSGVHGSSHLKDHKCVVCYGSGTQICPNCDGARKKFYTS